MTTKLVPILHILFGCLGLVFLKIAYPVPASGGESWFFRGLLVPPFLAIVLLGGGLACWPRVFKTIVVFVHRAFIALTICVFIFLLWVIRGQEGGIGAAVLLVLTFAMVFLSFFSGLTLYLLRDKNVQLKNK